MCCVGSTDYSYVVEQSPLVEDSLVQKLDASSLNSDWMNRGKALATLLASSAFALV